MDLGIEPTPNIHTILVPPLGLQANATELGENHWLEKVIKEVLSSLKWRGGTKLVNACFSCWELDLCPFQIWVYSQQNHIHLGLDSSHIMYIRITKVLDDPQKLKLIFLIGLMCS
jgi:hypothetical protein